MAADAVILGELRSRIVKLENTVTNVPMPQITNIWFNGITATNGIIISCFTNENPKAVIYTNAITNMEWHYYYYDK